MHRNATAVYMEFCHILIILAHREGPCVRAVELGLVGAMLGSQRSKAKAIKQGNVDGARACLGHVQHI
jgi:hypothetical protein